MKKRALKLHRLYLVAFEHLQADARKLGMTLKALAQSDDYRGKVLRRGTPGAFGWAAPKPLRWAFSDRRGYNAPGNSRDRRFARRHPNHFTTAPVEINQTT